MKKEINLVIELSEKIVSINALYRAAIKYVSGRPIPFIYKTDVAKRMGAQIMNSLRAVDWTEHIPWLKETKYFTVTQNYIFKTGIDRRDVENGAKGISDFVVKFIHDELGISTFDDSKFSDLHLYKNILPGSKKEYICISIKPSTYELRYDNVEKPEKILFWAESCEFYTPKFRKAMKEKSLSCQLYQKDKKIKEHDTDVFLIDSAGKNRLDLVVGILDYIYPRKDNTGKFIIYGFYQKSDQDIVDKINSFGLSRIKAKVIDNPLDLFDKE